MSLNEFLGQQFDWRGETNRKQYGLYFFCGLLFSFVYLIPLFYWSWEYVNATIDYGSEAASVILFEDEMAGVRIVLAYLWSYFGLIWGFAYTVIYLMATSRRLAHIGWSRWWLLLYCVPVVNFFFWLVLLFTPKLKK